ncbi:ATP-binding protein [Cytophagaceae bacterium ABcell3]|nr:ATP-binding protein [Cytophagaceae bacterium ABcell3]
MKIQDRLTLQFTGILSLILLVFCFVVLFFSGKFIKNDFYDLLEKRAYITANIFLEADELSAAALERYQKKYIQNLPEEIIKIYDLNNQPVFVKEDPQFVVPDEVINTIRSKKKIQYAEGDRQFTGIFYKDNQGDFVIVASAVDVSGLKKIDHLLAILLVTFIVSVFVTFIAGRIFVYQGLLPIKGVICQMSEINANNMFKRVNEGNGNDEISELASSFNQMLDRLQQAFDMQKTFVSNASHELRTPITSISGELQFALMKNRSAEEYRAALESMKEEIDKLSIITESLLNYAKASFDVSKITFKKERIDELIQLSIELLEKAYAGRKITLNLSKDIGERALYVKANAQLMVIVFKNILENALKFSGHTEKVILDILRDGQRLCISIKDSGVGISSEDLEKVFVTFFRSSEVRNIDGHGIGLALAKKILELHQGSIDIKSKLGHGTEVLITIPVYDTETASAPPVIG